MNEDVDVVNYDENYLYKIKKNYNNINKIDNCKIEENKLYKNKNIKEKVFFEIQRINKMKLNESQMKKLDQIIRFYEMIIINKIDDYSDILAAIFKLELELDLKIGLFEEFKIFASNEIEKLNEEKNKTYK